MATPSPSTPAAQPRRETPRLQLARLAGAAALAEPGITGLDAGPSGRRGTFSGTERLPGVEVVADGPAYAVALFLTAEPTALDPLAARVTAAVRSAAASVGLGDALGAVHVTFTDLTLPDQITSA